HLVFHRYVGIPDGEAVPVVRQEVGDEEVAARIRRADLDVVQVTAHSGQTRHAQDRESVLDGAGQEQALAENDERSGGGRAHRVVVAESLEARLVMAEGRVCLQLRGDVLRGAA